MLTNFGEITNLGDISDLGGIPGAIPWNKFGFGTVNTSFSTIYSPGTNPGLYRYLDTPKTIAVASTDPDDTFGGTGGNTVQVSGLCDEGCLHDEIINLNGQTPVESETVFSRVFRIINLSSEGHELQGQLYVGPSDAIWTGGEPDHILAHINDGYNQTQMALYTVPKGYTLFVYTVVVCAPGTKETEVAVFARQADITDLSNSMVMTVKINWLLSGAPLSISMAGTPYIFPENIDFEFRAKVDATTSSIAANAKGYLIPNKYIRG